MPDPAIVTIALVLILCVALASYLTIIAYQLSKVSFELGTVLIGVRSIEFQTRPLGTVVGGIGDDVEAMEAAFRGLLPADDPTSGSTAHGRTNHG